MTPYTIAWLVAGSAGLLGVLAMLALTRNFANHWLRRAFTWLPPLLLLVPAEVPGFAGNYAPAFVVLVFESLFQVEGEPMAAARMLVVAGLVGLVAITAASRFGRGINSQAAQKPEMAPGPE